MNAVATLTLSDVHATVSPDGDTFVLWWTDYVANEWTETHPDLGTALARRAAPLRHARGRLRRRARRLRTRRYRVPGRKHHHARCAVTSTERLAARGDRPAAEIRVT
ncbi:MULTISPECIES: hypothetical protein [Actinomycetes]|uniref:hypothetical protein n=1 Tax=Actinomycetes TaxID=1760 RepID=UPI0004C21F4F|nr:MULTISPECIES: hypothetical protein [Actinomycetes]MCK0515944.1 hypothetical protein [Williamsia sp. DF01-3]